VDKRTQTSAQLGGRGGINAACRQIHIVDGQKRHNGVRPRADFVVSSFPDRNLVRRERRYCLHMSVTAEKVAEVLALSEQDRAYLARRHDEGEVLLTTRSQFAEGEVVRIQAPTDGSPVFSLHTFTNRFSQPMGSVAVLGETPSA
jgi:hypothetical protein